MKFILFKLVLVLFLCNSCTSYKKINSGYEEKPPLFNKYVIKELKEIIRFLEKNNFETATLSYIFIVHKFSQPTFCSLISDSLNLSYLDIEKNLKSDSNIISALVIDSDDKYIANTTKFQFTVYTEKYYDYFFQLNLIDFYIKEKYLGYFQMTCPVLTFIAFNYDKVDIYEVIDDKLIIKSSIPIN